jgi:hypothetical protein
MHRVGSLARCHDGRMGRTYRFSRIAEGRS